MSLNGNGHYRNAPKQVRGKDEIQRAHDLLEAWMHDIEEADDILGEQPKLVIHIARDVLCWVLRHDNDVFQENIDRLGQITEELGYEYDDGSLGGPQA